MTAVITKTTIESNSYKNVFDIMNNRSNISDPRDPSGARPLIYNYDPYESSVGFSGLPYIILELPELRYENTSCNGKEKTVRWLNRITIRSTLKGVAGTYSGIGTTDILSLSDELQSLFNSEVIKLQFRHIGMFNMKLTKTSVDTFDSEGKTVHEFEYELEYYTRMVVSD